ncbi:MAG: hypothetical protein K5882_04695 [Bacteroidales bacterium]|nr:hypothetical protein [Bacteroidales bacterium]
MISTGVNPTVNITDLYMSVLASLSVDTKLDLIAKLSASIKNDSERIMPKEDLRTMFCGNWTDMPLRDESYYGREILSW